MGIDVNIYVVGEQDILDADIEKANELFSEIFYNGGDGKFEDCFERAYDGDRRNNIIMINSLDRYYGEGYERGPWPKIFAKVMFALAHFPDARVYYLSDSHDFTQTDDNSWCEASQENLAKLWAHYLKHGHTPYRGFFRLRGNLLADSTIDTSTNTGLSQSQHCSSLKPDGSCDYCGNGDCR